MYRTIYSKITAYYKEPKEEERVIGSYDYLSIPFLIENPNIKFIHLYEPSDCRDIVFSHLHASLRGINSTNLTENIERNLHIEVELKIPGCTKTDFLLIKRMLKVRRTLHALRNEGDISFSNNTIILKYHPLNEFLITLNLWCFLIIRMDLIFDPYPENINALQLPEILQKIKTALRENSKELFARENYCHEFLGFIYDLFISNHLFQYYLSIHPDRFYSPGAHFGFDFVRNNVSCFVNLLKNEYEPPYTMFSNESDIQYIKLLLKNSCGFNLEIK